MCSGKDDRRIQRVYGTVENENAASIKHQRYLKNSSKEVN